MNSIKNSKNDLSTVFKKYYLFSLLLISSTYAKNCSIDEVQKVINNHLGTYKTVKSAGNKVHITPTVTTLDEVHGENFLRTLVPHGDMRSTTAFRVEEKAVISQDSLDDFFKVTESTPVKGEKGTTITTKWGARDPKKEGIESKTITEYGKSVEYLDDATGVSIGFRPRFRKYFEYDEVGDQLALQNAKSVFPDMTAFELKIGNMGGFKEVKKMGADGIETTTLKPIAKESAVFKPRLFVTDAIADRIKNIDSKKSNYLDTLQDIENDILAMKKPDGTPINSPEKVHSMIEAVKPILKKQSRLFEPDIVVSYNRSSYRYLDDQSEYQFTVDRNIEIFKPKKSRESARMNDYMTDKALLKMGENEVFAELKTPIPVHNNRDNNELYRLFINNLNSGHIPSYKLGKGKYSLGKKNSQKLKAAKSKAININETGTKYWLIRNTGNLPSPPRVKSITEQDIIEVAVPFKGLKDRDYRAVITYRPLFNQNGDNVPRLSKVKFIDDNGIKVDEVKNAFIEESLTKPNVMTHLLINEQKIEFPSRLTTKEAEEYKTFFKKFYYNPGKEEGFKRGLKQLTKVQSPLKLSIYEKTLKYVLNPSAWLKDRLNKIVIGAAVGGLVSATVAINVLGTNDRFKSSVDGALAPSNKQQDNNKQMLQSTIKLNDPIRDQPIDLIMKEADDGGYVFLIPEKAQALYNKDTIFKDKNGQVFNMKLKTHPDKGYKYFTMGDTPS